jgi:hypothetical protein
MPHSFSILPIYHPYKHSTLCCLTSRQLVTLFQKILVFGQTSVVKGLKGHSNSALGYHNGDIFRFRPCTCRFVGNEIIYLPLNHINNNKILINPALQVYVSNLNSSNANHIIFTVVRKEGSLFQACTLLSACHAMLAHVGQLILPNCGMFCYLRCAIHEICTLPS